MKKRVPSMLLATAMLASISMTACGGSATSTAASTTTDSASTADSTSTAATDDTGDALEAYNALSFPDGLPANPTLAEDGYYDYDDMSQHYDIELLTTNYGVTPPADDPIKAYLEKKYNVSITFTTVLQDDLENILSTRFSSGDVPDLFMLPSADYGMALGEQGLLVDARTMYPYLPQTVKFVTEPMIEWSSMDNGEIPFITRYATQDGDVWGLALR